ncbi:MAG: ABC transporter permease subunit [Coriobacteriales bacterium]|jgi:iron(III) transport system permease protein|nr:ABC transporter permease subunit [Coriobacteriales bacterium]
MRRGPLLASTKLVCLVFFLVAVVLPLARMLIHLSDTDVAAIITAPRFAQALTNSLLVSVSAALISLAIASILAWAVTRTNLPGKRLWSILFTLPMLIPSISHGMGLVVLFGANGFLTRLLGIDGSIYGFWGIVTGSVLYSFPVGFLMISDVLRYEDATPYEAADVLGISRLRQFAAITVPYMRKPMIAAIFTVFTLIITDYGVPLMIGGQCITLPVMMYQDVVGLLDFGKGSVIGLVLLVPALIAFAIDLLTRDRGNAGFVLKSFTLRHNVRRDLAALVASVLVALFVLLPIASFVVLTFVSHYPNDLTLTLANIGRAFGMKAGTYLLNSVIIACSVALIGCAVSFIVAYFTARSSGRLSHALHLFSIVSLAIPGLVLGLSYVLFFKGTLLYGSLAILVLANMMHFFSSPYLMIYNTLGKLNANLEAVGATLGVGRFAIVRDVLLPQSRLTLVEMFTYFFVNSMMTISAVSFLANTATRPLSLMIPSFEATMMLECAAFVSLLILVVNLALSGGMGVLKKVLGKRSGGTVGAVVEKKGAVA